MARIRDGANRTGYGTACVAKYEEGWRVGGASGLVLENCKRERPGATVLCLARAWQEAFSQLVGTRAKVPLPSTDGLPCGQTKRVLLPPGAALSLGTAPAVEAHHGR